MGSVKMPKMHEFRHGKFIEIDPGPHADWAKLGIETAWFIGMMLSNPWCGSSTLLPAKAVCQGYHGYSRQLREIFTYIDRYGLLANHDGAEAISANPQMQTDAEVYLDALNTQGAEHSF